MIAERGHDQVVMQHTDEIAIAIKNKLMVPLTGLRELDLGTRNAIPPLAHFAIVTVDRNEILAGVESAKTGRPGWAKFKDGQGRIQVRTGNVEFWVDPNRIPRG